MPETISLKAEREKLRAPANRIRQLADLINAEGRDFTAEEKGEWERVNADYDAGARRLEALVRAEEIEAKLAVPDKDRLIGRTPWPKGGDGAAITEATSALAFQGWMRYQADLDPTAEQEEAAQKCGVRLRSRGYDFARPTRLKTQPIWQGRGQADYRAALSGHDVSAGGALIPSGFINNLEIALLQYGGVRAVADVMTTTGGEPLPWPTANDTSNTGRQIGENAGATAGLPTVATNPVFGALVFNAYLFTSDFILIPTTLMMDSAFNLAETIGTMLGIRLGRITATRFTTGTGANTCTGILTASTLGVTAASATAIAADELFNLIHSIDPAYRQGPGVGWMFHDSIFLAIRKLKDGQGRYLWQEGLTVGAPNMLLDYPYQISQDMPSSIAASAKTMLFGALNKYKIRDVAGVRLKRDESRFIENDQVAFIAYSRHDGNLLDAGTHPVKYFQQHS